MTAILGRLRALAGRGRRQSAALSAAAFRLRYERFRELLTLNDATLQLFADIEDRLASPEAFALAPLMQRVRKAAVDVFFMVKDLNQLADGRHSDLYEALGRVSDGIEDRLQRLRGVVAGPPVLPVAALRASDAALAGAKMANLGEVAAACGEEVPPGFAITTAAFDRFLSEGGLWERCEALEGLLESGGPAALAEGSAEVRAAIFGAELPAELASAIAGAWEEAFRGGEVRVAVRSSAVGEDASAASHAGIYTSRLDVPRSSLLHVYREVVASAFSEVAVAYRFARGLTAGDSAMAVGCLRMLEPRWSGIMFSRHPQRLDDDQVMISATAGVAAPVAAGTADAPVWVGPPQGPFSGGGDLLDAADLERLAAAARRLEAHFGGPQDVEWALEPDGRLVILQTRPMVASAASEAAVAPGLEGLPVLAEGGATACPGVGSGPVVVVGTEVDVQRFPEGAVLLARHSSPALLPAMTRAAAVLTEVGSPTGHMAILARELGVPTIVGMGDVRAAVTVGQRVTVDAGARRVLAGGPPVGTPAPGRRQPEAGSPVLRALGEVADLLTPLHLTDPASRRFAPASCRTLHDITRFVHEKAFEVMFHFGDAAAADRHHSYLLEAPLPIEIRVFDVGGGLVAESYPSGRVERKDIASIPMQAFLSGLVDERLSWQRPRAVSMKGFLSVLGESMVGPPPDAQQVGRLSYAILSDRYLNFSTKAGYHFSTVDSYCGPSVNGNYIHFRFSGGAADARRRTRRIAFLRWVLEALGFVVHARGDILHARFDKYEEELILERLADLGRATMCSRQLDMLMDSDASPEFFAEAFLEGRFDSF